MKELCNLYYKKINICLACNQVITIVIYILWTLIVYMIIGIETTYAMEHNNNDAEIIKNAMLASQAGNEEEVRRILEVFNGITDPQRLVNLQNLINTLAEHYQVRVDNLHIHHSDTLTLANAGVPPTENNERSWTSILGDFTLFVGISLVGYVIFRNWESIRAFLFDCGTHAIDMITLQHYQIARGTVRLLNNPITHDIFINQLIAQGFISATTQGA